VSEWRKLFFLEIKIWIKKQLKNKKQIVVFEDKKIRKIILKKDKKSARRHNYKNAIKVGNIDYKYPLRDKLLDCFNF
jgi:hypothetical protein